MACARLGMRTLGGLVPRRTTLPREEWRGRGGARGVLGGGGAGPFALDDHLKDHGGNGQPLAHQAVADLISSSVNPNVRNPPI